MGGSLGFEGTRLSQGDESSGGARGVATHADFERAGLPGETEAVETVRDARGATVGYTVVFQDGYDPRVDGCIFAPTVGGVPITGRYIGGASSVDLSHCAP